MISLEILRAVERELGAHDLQFRLCDVFDYIAGTSTGAIIAAALSTGASVEEVVDLYRKMGPRVFRRRLLPGWVRSLYPARGLKEQLVDFFGDRTFGDQSLRSLLLVVTHRTDTDSVWPLSNNPDALYNATGGADDNLAIPLWQLLRGSSAAPFYFPPEEIEIGDQRAVFQDGGITPFNNPAPILFTMATSPQYRLRWETGVDKLLIVSVGTGASAAVHPGLSGKMVNAMFNATNLLRVMMNSSSTENDRLCRVLGTTRFGPPIDSEFNAPNLDDDMPTGSQFTYIRYNIDISPDALARNPTLADIDARRVGKMDRPAALDDLQRIGRVAAEQVDREHFSGFWPR